MKNGLYDEHGYKLWYKDGLLHRLDGPAIIHADGSEEWYVEGKLHRLDGPAVIGSDGRQEWWVDGVLHRLDGPAICWWHGLQRAWYVDGMQIIGHHLQILGLSDYPANGFTEDQITLMRVIS